MKFRCFALCLLFAVLLAACGAKTTVTGAGGAATRTPVEQYAAYPPVHIDVAVDFATLNTCTAPLIAAVTVGSMGPGHWNTPNGKRPAFHDTGWVNGDALFTNGYYIYTPVYFSRMQIVSDRRTQPTLQYVTMGGQDGQDSMRVDGYGQVQAGQRFLLIFTYASDPATHNINQHTLVVQQDYPMNAQGQVQQFNPAYANSVGPDTPNEWMYVPLNQAVQKMKTCK